VDGKLRIADRRNQSESAWSRRGNKEWTKGDLSEQNVIFVKRRDWVVSAPVPYLGGLGFKFFWLGGRLSWGYTWFTSVRTAKCHDSALN
jgi:hypothetical protein